TEPTARSLLDPPHTYSQMLQLQSPAKKTLTLEPSALWSIQ
ncbi:5712_t:CDS:1, partial [Dentiscutata heterogama]